MTAAATFPREERLRTATGLRGSPALALSAWRGRSGRRYVVGIHEMNEPAVAEVGDAVVIAVRRDAAGIAKPVAVTSASDRPTERRRLAAWAESARKAGASELHIHRLAESDAERRAIEADLSEGV